MRPVRAGKPTEPLRADSPAYPARRAGKETLAASNRFRPSIQHRFCCGRAGFDLCCAGVRVWCWCARNDYARGAAYAPPLPIEQPVQSPEAGEPKSILVLGLSNSKRVLAVLRPANSALTST